MQIKYILASAAIAMFAIPGTASQLSARAAMSAPATNGTAGLFSDPHGTPQLSIALPTRFVAAWLNAREWSRFAS